MKLGQQVNIDDCDMKLRFKRPFEDNDTDGQTMFEDNGWVVQNLKRYHNNL